MTNLSFKFWFVCLVAFAAAPAWATSWTWALSGAGASGTFTAVESGTGTHLSGSFTRQSNGLTEFTGLTCSAGQCTGLPTTIWAIESPGLHMIIQPVLTGTVTETQPIYSIENAGCPTTSATLNWMVTQWSSSSDIDSSTQVVAGVSTYSTSGSGQALAATTFYNNTSYGTLSLGTVPFPINATAGCAYGTAGYFSLTGSGDRGGTMYITSQGEYFFSTSDNHGFFAVPQATVGSTNAIAGYYSGFIFDASGSNTVQPITQMLLQVSGTSLSGNGMNTNGTVNTSFTRTFSVTAVDSPGAGFVEGTITDGVHTAVNMTCMAGINLNGRNHLFCSGEEPGNATIPYTMILISAGGQNGAPAWTWVGGDTVSGETGTYGIKGTAGATIIPGGLSGFSSAADSHGNFWVFGGQSVSNGAYMNSLWEYNATSGLWAWRSGTSVQFQFGSYGTRGTASVNYAPGGRAESNSWFDKSGNFWVFGGYGWMKSGTNGRLNELWKYDTTGKWTWVSGSSVAIAFGQPGNGTYGTLGTSSATNVPNAVENANSWVDSVGNAWVFGGEANDSLGNWGYQNTLWRYDTSGKWTWMSGSKTLSQSGTYGTLGTANAANMPGAREESIIAVDSVGQFWVFGGYGYDQAGNSGDLNDLWIYNGTSGHWKWISGNNTKGQLSTFGTQGVASATNSPGGRVAGAGWIDSSGNFWIFGGSFYISNTSGRLSEIWKYNGTSGQWTFVSGDASMGGTYGTLGIPSALNTPGYRYNMGSWVDSSGNFWIFGNPNDYDDMWRLSGNALNAFP